MVGKSPPSSHKPPFQAPVLTDWISGSKRRGKGGVGGTLNAIQVNNLFRYSLVWSSWRQQQYPSSQHKLLTAQPGHSPLQCTEEKSCCCLATCQSGWSDPDKQVWKIVLWCPWIYWHHCLHTASVHGEQHNQKYKDHEGLGLRILLRVTDIGYYVYLLTDMILDFLQANCLFFISVMREAQQIHEQLRMRDFCHLKEINSELCYLFGTKFSFADFNTMCSLTLVHEAWCVSKNLSFFRTENKENNTGTYVFPLFSSVTYLLFEQTDRNTGASCKPNANWRLWLTAITTASPVIKIRQWCQLVNKKHPYCKNWHKVTGEFKNGRLLEPR